MFYGHLGKFSVTALCDVTGGPKYELELIGEASLVDFNIDRKRLDFGTRLYQEIVEQEIFLSNIGHVAFDFNVLIPSRNGLQHKIMVSPSSGQIASFGKQRIVVRFSPCVPEAVHDYFLIQVAHFEPAKITVHGNGIYPDCFLDLPRVPNQRFDEILSSLDASGPQSHKKEEDAEETVSDFLIDEGKRVEVERLLLKERTIAFLENLGDEFKSKNSGSRKFVGSSVIAQKNLNSRDRKSSSLLETSQVQSSFYTCHFGNVIRNTAKKRTFKLFNKSTGTLAFTFDRTPLSGTGFSLEVEKTKVLLGESVEFTVTFQMKGPSVEISTLSVTLPICVINGPTILLTLKADVTVPDLSVSSKQVSFGEVLCGHRKTVTIALTNINSVKCEWNAQTLSNDIKGKETSNRRNTKKDAAAAALLLLKKKMPAALLKDVVLEPSSGMLLPGETATLMIRFSPTDDKDYDMLVYLSILNVLGWHKGISESETYKCASFR
jgi:hydrocephalus-inducing protein